MKSKLKVCHVCWVMILLSVTGGCERREKALIQSATKSDRSLMSYGTDGVKGNGIFAEDESEQVRQDALRKLREYVSREEVLLRSVVDDSSKEIEAILKDQKRLSEALLAIEKENAKRSEAAKTNGWTRYEKAEVVMMQLKDPVMNELALRYLGEDFSTLRTECRGKIKTALALQADTAKRLKENREKYQRQLVGIEDEVDAKTSKAQEITQQANKDLEARMADLTRLKKRKEQSRDRLRAIDRKPQWVQKEIQVVEQDIMKLDKEISRVGEIVAVSRGNVAHLAATAAETAARRKGDAAISVRQDEDNAVHAEMAHVRTVFNLAAEFEGRSLDKLSASMRSRKDILSVRMNDAQEKIEFLNRASLNADLLKPDELEDLRQKVAAKIGDTMMKSLP